MSQERNQPGVLSFVALFLALLVVYIMSEGLILWLVFQGRAPEWMLALHAPLKWLRDFVAHRGL